MAGERSRTCRCGNAEPFVVGSTGRFRTLAGQPLPRDLGGGRRSGRPAPGLPPGAGSTWGARTAATWAPEADVGLPPLVHAGTTLVPVAGGPPTSGASTRAPQTPAPGPVVDPIGVRPAVAPLPAVDFQRVGRPAVPGPQPYGMTGSGAGAESLLGPGSSASGEGDVLRRIQPQRQYVPPPPAPQDFCIVNGFDPRWGTPPGSWRGVVLRFDPALGAYRFDPDSSVVRKNFARVESPELRAWFEEVGQRYRTGYMLQPYRPDDGAGQWAFRWIPRRQEVICA